MGPAFSRGLQSDARTLNRCMPKPARVLQNPDDSQSLVANIVETDSLRPLTRVRLAPDHRTQRHRVLEGLLNPFVQLFRQNPVPAVLQQHAALLRTQLRIHLLHRRPPPCSCPPLLRLQAQPPNALSCSGSFLGTSTPRPPARLLQRSVRPASRWVSRKAWQLLSEFEPTLLSSAALSASARCCSSASCFCFLASAWAIDRSRCAASYCLAASILLATSAACSACHCFLSSRSASLWALRSLANCIGDFLAVSGGEGVASPDALEVLATSSPAFISWTLTIIPESPQWPQVAQSWATDFHRLCWLSNTSLPAVDKGRHWCIN
jgi:hypothetical protein